MELASPEGRSPVWGSNHRHAMSPPLLFIPYDAWVGEWGWGSGRLPPLISPLPDDDGILLYSLFVLMEIGNPLLVFHQ